MQVINVEKILQGKAKNLLETTTLVHGRFTKVFSKMATCPA